MNPFDLILINPIFNILIAFYKVLEIVHIPGALGFAIILLTIAIRLALWPLTSTQLRSTQKMAALKPHLSRIKEEHGHDKLRHQQEVNKLYKEHGVNPLTGCLPILLQLPVFIALYNVLSKIVQFDKSDFLANINSHLYFSSLHLQNIPNPSFFGFNLAAKPNEWQAVGFIILSIPVLTGVLQFVQSKMMMPETAPKKPEGGKTGGLEESMGQVQSQMTYLMPLMIAFFSYGFPVGLSLYWNTFTIIGIIQQYKIMGAGALNKYLPESLRKRI